LIESGKTREESTAMENMAASSNLIAGFAPYVDLASPSLEEELDSWSTNPKFRAVRARFEGNPDPDILAREEILQGIAKIAERGIILELLVRAAHLKYILKIYERFQHLKSVIEHMAKPDLQGQSDRGEWESGMKALATDTSVACKLSFSPRRTDRRTAKCARRGLAHRGDQTFCRIPAGMVWSNPTHVGKRLACDFAGRELQRHVARHEGSSGWVTALPRSHAI
jgi:predicted TIM-barrel fold metal-dependent hydrolase